jgi:hypothetical protein
MRRFSVLKRSGVAILIVLHHGMVVAFDGPPSTQDVIQRCQESAKALDFCHLRFKERSYDTSNPGIPEFLTAERIFTCYRDEQRWRVRIDSTAYSEVGKKTVGAKTVTENVIDTESLKLVQIAGNARASTRDKYHGAASRDPVVGGKELRNIFGIGTIFFGTLHTDDSPLWKVLTDAESFQVLARPEMLDGVETYAVTATAKKMNYRLNVAPSNSYLPVKIEVSGPGRGEIADTRLGTIAFYGNMRSGKPPVKITPQMSTRRFNNIKVSNYNGKYVISAMNYAVGNIFPGDQKEYFPARFEYRLEAVEFDRAKWPADAFAPSLKVPDGTRVALVEEPTMAHEIVNGELRKAVDRRVATQEDIGFKRNPTRMSLILAANVILLAIIGIIGAFRWNAARHR